MKTVFLFLLGTLYCSFGTAQVIGRSSDEKTESKATYTYDSTNKTKQLFRTFTHFEKVDDDTPPGMIQTELLFSWALIHRKYKCEHFLGVKTSPYFIVPFRNMVLPSVQINKFDLPDAEVAPVRIDTSMHEAKINNLVNYFDLIQYSFFNSYFKLNGFTLMTTHYKLQGDLFMNYYRTYVTSINDSTKKEPVNSSGYGFGFRFSSTYSEKESPVNFSLTISNFWFSLMSNHYDQIQSTRSALPQTQKILINQSDYIQEKFPPIQTYSLEITYKSKYWVRMILNNNFIAKASNYNWEPSTKYNNFFQVQLGAEIPLTDIEDLFGIKKKEEKKSP